MWRKIRTFPTFWIPARVNVKHGQAEVLMTKCCKDKHELTKKNGGGGCPHRTPRQFDLCLRPKRECKEKVKRGAGKLRLIKCGLARE